MEFYYIIYKRQYLTVDNKWTDTDHQSNKIIVIADCMEAAHSKIEAALKNVETRWYRAVPVGDVTLCIGLDLSYGYSFGVYPIE